MNSTNVFWDRAERLDDSTIRIWGGLIRAAEPGDNEWEQWDDNTREQILDISTMNWSS